MLVGIMLLLCHTIHTHACARKSLLNDQPKKCFLLHVINKSYAFIIACVITKRNFFQLHYTVEMDWYQIVIVTVVGTIWSGQNLRIQQVAIYVGYI